MTAVYSPRKLLQKTLISHERISRECYYQPKISCLLLSEDTGYGLSSFTYIYKWDDSTWRRS